MTNMDRPTRHGAALGLALAAIADRGREVEDEGERCATCAFRPGTMPNQCAGTVKLALDCLSGVDASSRFACHHGIDAEGEATRRCAGYEAALHAPRSFTTEKLIECFNQLEAGWDGPDLIRADFDAWWKTVDPDRTMDVYQLARLYQARERKPMMIHNVDDRRRGWVGSWEAVPLVYDALTAEDVGRTVIYRDHGRAEAGTLSSWRDGTVFARYSRGDTAAGANPANLCFGVRALEGPEHAR